jgi:hypothetical protein
LEQAAKRASKAEKIAADKAVVLALSKRYGVEYNESKRPEFSGLTFTDNTARQALFKARDILRGGTVFAASAANVDPVEREAKRLAKMTPAQAKRAYERSIKLRAE